MFLTPRASKAAEDVARIVEVVPGALTQRPTHDFGPDAGSARGGVPADTLRVGIEAVVAEERKELFVGQYRPEVAQSTHGMAHSRAAPWTSLGGQRQPQWTV